MSKKAAELPYASNKEIADEKIGKWLSAALEDPTTCGAMKDDINEWFQAIEEERLRSKKKQINDELSDAVKTVMSSDYNQEVPCKTHSDAPHGFLRNESLTQNRYVCECEYWEPEEILVECCDGGGPVGAGCYHDHCTGPKTKLEVIHDWSELKIEPEKVLVDGYDIQNRKELKQLLESMIDRMDRIEYGDDYLS